MFITFEGGEGAGKTTQIAHLANRLRQAGHEVLTLREPGSAPGAEAIRDLVLNGPVERWDAAEELMLFSAARHELVRTKIKPALQAGAMVLCDRFADSSAVYQGRAGGIAPDTLQTIEDLAVQGLQPDLTLLIDVPVALGLSRAGKRIDAVKDGQGEGRFEDKDLNFHEAVRAAFLDRAAQFPKRFHVLAGDQEEGALADQIWAEVQTRMPVS